jgi:AcrR family transcriptional regulator
VEEILQSAARVFRERGYHGGTLEEVGARLGITRAALYYYFRNKQAVLAELLTRAMRVGVTQLDAAMAASDDPEERLVIAITRLIELIARERGLTMWAGRSEYRLRRGDEGWRMAGKTVTLVDGDRPLHTLAFLI